MIALLCSIQAEADRLMDAMNVKSSGMYGSKRVFQGTIAGKDVLLCIGGIGKVNAAHATTILFTRYSVRLLIVFGIAGAYPRSGARIGDVALASEEIARRRRRAHGRQI